MPLMFSRKYALGNLAILLICGCLGLPLLAQETQPTPTSGIFRTVLLPRSLKTAASVPVVKDGWAYANPARIRGERQDDTALEAPTDLELIRKTDEVDMAQVEKEATAYLNQLLIRQPVQYFRDANQVVEYAAITGEDPCIASLILLPEFFRRFEPVFGAEFRVVAPDQFTLYLFPKQGGTLEQFARPLAGAYRESAQPVSLEVFEVSKDGIRVIAELPK